MGGDTRASRAASPTNGHNNYVEVGLRFQHFERMRADPCDEQRFIAGMDVAVAMFALQNFTVTAAVVEFFTVKDDIRSHALNGGDFTGIRAIGDDNIGLYPEQPTSISDR